MKTLLTRLLGLDACVNVHDKEQQILQNVTDEKMRKCLPLLNDLLSLKVQQPYVVYIIDYMYMYCIINDRQIHDKLQIVHIQYTCTQCTRILIVSLMIFSIVSSNLFHITNESQGETS